LVTGAALLASAAAAQEVPHPAFEAHRFDEDWRALCSPVLQIEPLDSLKCVRLVPETTLTLGGELRERFEGVRNPDFGLEQRSDHVFLHRAMVHGDLRFGQNFRTFVQLGAFASSGREGPRAPTDLDRLDLVQGFIDFNVSVAGGAGTLRGGRQELSFGSSRLVAVRESPNVRRAFDGGRAFWGDGTTRLDAFYVRPVTIAPGVFDDPTNDAERFWGVYGATQVAGIWRVDLYYLGIERERARFASGPGREERQTIGARLFGASGGWDWDWEAAYQFGRFEGADIRAWTVATDTGFTVADLPLSPRLGVKADIASGDRDGADGRLGTFNALYPKFPYFSEANLVAPANIIDLHPSLQLQLTPTLAAELGWNALWRQTTRDAIYAPPLEPIARTAGRGGRFIGQQSIVGLEWQATRQLTIAGQYVHFWRGDTLREVGGRDVDFVTGSASWKF